MLQLSCQLGSTGHVSLGLVGADPLAQHGQCGLKASLRSAAARSVSLLAAGRPHDSCNRATESFERPVMDVTVFITTLIPPRQMADALLQKQYFPNIKTNKEELPPFFTSLSFSHEIAVKLSQCQPRSASGTSFRTRRFDGLVRQMGIPHPVPYAKLVLHIEENWPSLSLKLDADQSMVSPRYLHNDGRVIIMDYGSTQEKTLREIQAAQGQRYHVSADVSNFFPSIYAHSIDWALRGMSKAKAGIKDGSWEARLDEYVENCHNSETKGIMIGPAAFNIISEIILQEIDRNLEAEGLGNYVRYVDDYSAYFHTLEEAEGFLQHLDRQLSSYRLQLNTRKTKVTALGSSFGEAWIGEIIRATPRKRSATEGINFLQHCERLAMDHPDKSVLVYAVKSLQSRYKCPEIGGVKKIPARRRRDIPILHELMRVAYFNPHIVPFVARQLAWCLPLLSKDERGEVSVQVDNILREACRRRETDICLWCIYILRVQLKSRMQATRFDELIKLDDDLIALACAITSAIGRRRAIDRAKGLNMKSSMDLEEHWLLRYELYRCKYLTDADLDPVVEGSWFKPARKERLAFSVLPSKSKPRRRVRGGQPTPASTPASS